jgi:S-ribosylhomocysteine lyase
MERIASFCVDHTRLLPGMYLSRQDGADGEILTWDIRMKQPNKGSYLSPAAAHTLEHLFATYARNSKYSRGVVYVGPMGCRTGMYVIFKGDLESADVAEIMKDCYQYMADFDEEIPAAKPEMCGNYLDHNLGITRIECQKFVDEVLSCIKEENMVYPRQNG